MYKIAVLILITTLWGCATTPRENPWPSPERVRAIAQESLKLSKTAKAPDTLLAEWTLTDPQEVAGSMKLEAQTPLEKHLETLILPHPNITQTQSHDCLAQELARFYALNNKRPNLSVLSFIHRRCGAIHDPAWTFWEVEGSHDEQATLTSYSASIAHKVSEIVKDSVPKEVGIAVFAAADKSILIIAHSKKEVDLAPLNMKVEGDTVEIRGTNLVSGIESMWGHINQGTHGYEGCVRVPEVQLPAFAFHCKILPTDPYATVVINHRKKGRYLGSTAFSLVVASGKTPSITYTPPLIRQELETADESDKNPALPYNMRVVELLNTVRRKQLMKPLTLEVAQSGSLTQMLPGLQQNDNPALADEVGRAIKAGWDIESPILSGGFVNGSSHTTDPVHHLDLMLEEPDGRATLLDPDTSLIAVGDIHANRSQYVIATYTAAAQETHMRRIGHILRFINAERAKYGLPPAKECKKTRTHAIALSRQISTSEITFEDAAQSLVDKYYDSHGPSRATWHQVNEFHDVYLPPNILRMKDLTISIAVALVKPPGFPWHEYQTIIAYPK